jgi:hypothetical protein
VVNKPVVPCHVRSVCGSAAALRRRLQKPHPQPNPANVFSPTTLHKAVDEQLKSAAPVEENLKSTAPVDEKDTLE